MARSRPSCSSSYLNWAGGIWPKGWNLGSAGVLLDPGIWVALRGQRVAPGLCRRGWEGWMDNGGGGHKALAQTRHKHFIKTRCWSFGKGDI